MRLVQIARSGAEITRVSLRTVPIIEDDQTVGMVTEKSSITLRPESRS